MKNKNIFIKLSIYMYLLLFFIFCFNTYSKAQITLEHTFDNTFFGRDFYITDIGNNNSKYVFIDTLANSFSLYNLDGTPFLLNILTPEPIMPRYSIAYITSTLFDCDSSNIEYAFMSYLDGTKPFRVMRTNGTVLLKVDSARGPVCYGCLAGSKEIVPIVNTQEGAKLFLFKLDVRRTLIYGLCGTLPSTISPFDISSNNQYIKVYPNPTSMSINFDFTLPDNLLEFEFTVFNSSVQEIKKEIINGQFTNINLDLSNYSDGEYYYKLSSKNKVYQSGKFTLTK
jgi:hypothetical protein